jgi:hypothetical protein
MSERDPFPTNDRQDPSKLVGSENGKTMTTVKGGRSDSMPLTGVPEHSPEFDHSRDVAVVRKIEITSHPRKEMVT